MTPETIQRIQDDKRARDILRLNNIETAEDSRDRVEIAREMSAKGLLLIELTEEA
ncbi:MAG TPA: hypothetical protein VGE34_01485 [Candidatus Saccharimonadales bacterium]